MELELHNKKQYSFQAVDMSRCGFILWDNANETEKNLFDAIESKELYLLSLLHKLEKPKMTITDYQNLFEKLGFGEIEVTMAYIENLQLTLCTAKLTQKQFLTLKTFPTKTWKR